MTGRRIRVRRDLPGAVGVPPELARFDLDDWPGLTAEDAAAQWIRDRERWHALHAVDGRSLLGDLTDLYRARREARLAVACGCIR